MTTTFNKTSELLNCNDKQQQRNYIVDQHNHLKRNHNMISSIGNNSYIRVLSISIIFMIIIIFSGIIIANAATSNVEESSNFKYYTSINIEKGDTLWSIASEYVSGTKTINNYVNDIIEINNLPTDCIYQGQNLIVYYYSKELK